MLLSNKYVLSLFFSVRYLQRFHKHKNHPGHSHENSCDKQKRRCTELPIRPVTCEYKKNESGGNLDSQSQIIGKSPERAPELILIALIVRMFFHGGADFNGASYTDIAQNITKKAPESRLIHEKSYFHTSAVSSMAL